MKEYKIVTFEESIKYVRLTREAWDRVKAVPKEEYSDAVRREFSWPEGFLDSLRGKTIQEQMQCYRIVEEVFRTKTAYGEITKENKLSFGCALEDYKGLNALIVDDGILIGVMAEHAFDHSGPGAPMFPYVNICTYYASDNEGSGYNDRSDYAHLCCVID